MSRSGDASSPGNWDCSSFVSYVLGHDLGLALPGNGRFGEPGYPPNSHGPVVVDYANWQGARTVPAPPQPGDLCCFVGLGASGQREEVDAPHHLRCRAYRRDPAARQHDQRRSQPRHLGD